MSDSPPAPAPLHRLTWGPSDGPTVILVHGLTGTAALWADVAERLAAAGRRVIAPDLRGHGASPKTGDLSLAGHAADLTALLEQTGPACVVGHSLGAAVAWTVAAARPDLVRRLVLEDQHPDANPGGWRGWQDWAGAWPARFDSRDEGLEFLAAAGRSASWWIPSLVEKDGATWGWSFDMDAVVATSQSLSATESWGTLAQIQAPTLLLRGAKSPHLRQDVAERMAAAMPRCELAVVPERDHWVHEEPAPYAAILLDFLHRPD